MRSSGFGAAGVILAVGSAAQAIGLDVTVTSDNVYHIFSGTSTQIDTYVGGDNDWPSAESYHFDLPTNNFIYVVAYSDDLVAQGFLAQFTSDKGTFYSSDVQWRVTATGIDLDLFDQVPSMEDLTTQVGLANAGNNPSGGWVHTTAGGANGVGPWGPIGGIDAEAKWTWYDSGKDPSNGAPFNGFNHDEYLIFRISVNVPAPGTAAATGLAAVGLVRRRR